MNAGGIALDWFRSVYCSEMQLDAFFTRFVSQALEKWIDRELGVRYIPFLIGARYSLENLTAEFQGMTHETTREEMLCALVKWLYAYQREHLKNIAIEVPLSNKIHITGGATRPEMIHAKKRWLRACRYDYYEQSSMEGVAMLANAISRKCEVQQKS
jgi:sugar (pentulose or hexulose) kinase